MVKNTRVPKRQRFDWLERQLTSPQEQREYAAESCIVAVTEAIATRMREAGLSRSEVAAKIGVTKGHVSQLLSGRRNMTLRSLAELLWACGLEVRDLALGSLGVSIVPEEMLCDVQVADAEAEVDAGVGMEEQGFQISFDAEAA
jgi:transcriptional regulator with XRE-family HTH domain